MSNHVTPKVGETATVTGRVLAVRQSLTSPNLSVVTVLVPTTNTWLTAAERHLLREGD